MKISNSKKQLAKIISENGGWLERARFATQDKGDFRIGFWSWKEGPIREGDIWKGNGWLGTSNAISCDKLLPNWHCTILSRDEYFHLYPATDADGWIEWKGGECPVAPDTMVVCRLVEGHEWRDGAPVKASSMCWSFNGRLDIVAYRIHKTVAEVDAAEAGPTWQEPTIEQLAAEYRSRKDYAERKQQEADEAKAEADAKLADLVAAGKAVGLVVIVAVPEPELVTTDWRDLQVGDVVWWHDASGAFSGEYWVAPLPVPDNVNYYPAKIWNNNSEHYIDLRRDQWRFIRRHAKEADNASPLRHLNHRRAGPARA